MKLHTFTIAFVLSFSVCVSFYAQAEEGNPAEAAYWLEPSDSLISQFTPVFLIEENSKHYNKIGTPSARYSTTNREEIYVDTTVPTVYHETHTFSTDQGTYTNLVYRIHFVKTPIAWVPLNVGAGKNVGAMVVITLNEDEQVIFVSTVQTCGCYHAIVPTNHLRKAAYSEDWSPNGRMVYGEYIPGRLIFPEGDGHRLVVSIRSGTHRTKGLSVMSLDEIQQKHPMVKMALAPMASLKSLPLGESTTSFYYEKGRKRGLVKGAHKPIEKILFGLWTWDSHVGVDREYGAKEDVGRRFYTTLNFSKKKKSDMWHYANYLNFNGWKL